MHENSPILRAKGRLNPLWLATLAAIVLGVYVYQSNSYHCDPSAAEASLANFSAQGIRGTNRPPSLSNLLWIHVGPQWHALPRPEKMEIDRIVRCAATVMDDQGQPTWQAAYYDHETGKLAALTSKRYGFRLKINNPEHSKNTPNELDPP